MTDDAAKIKRARQAGRRSQTDDTAGATMLSQAAEPAPATGVDTVGMAMRRPNKVLFAPSERLAVVQSSGFVPDSALSDYVRAETDATESFIPFRCTTSVSRMLWQRGALVRRDVYEAWQSQQAETTSEGQE